nr:hypothetical protein [uncultured Blautia sp.]
MAYIKFENIVKNYGRNVVLKNIKLEIEKGQLVTLLGPTIRLREKYAASVSCRT